MFLFMPKFQICKTDVKSVCSGYGGDIPPFYMLLINHLVNLASSLKCLCQALSLSLKSPMVAYENSVSMEPGLHMGEHRTHQRGFFGGGKSTG
jgi:hypothetical protein